MSGKVRSYLRKRLPPSFRTFKREIKDVMAAIGKNQITLNRLESTSKACETRIKELQSRQQQDGVVLRELASSIDRLIQQSAGIQDASKALSAMEQEAERQGRVVSETLWAEIFNSTVASSEWLRDKSFSPGRWAVGYPYLYVLYRALNEVRPKSILDLGLGQSTRMIAQYAAAHDDVHHFVVEHDEEWIGFFSRDFHLPESTHMLKLDWDFVPYKDAERVRVYSGFAEAVGDLQFDLISIDGPLGGDMKDYARIDVLGMLPNCLSPSFVVLMDDYERDAEARTVREMQNALSDSGVGFRSCRYSGSKELGLLCSSDLGFLCSM